MMRPVLLWWGSGALVVAVVLGVFVTWGGVGATAADVAWNTLMGDIRTPVLLDVAHVLDRLGGGWVAKYLIPLVVIAAPVRRPARSPTRPRRARPAGSLPCCCRSTRRSGRSS